MLATLLAPPSFSSRRFACSKITGASWLMRSPETFDIEVGRRFDPRGNLIRKQCGTSGSGRDTFTIRIQQAEHLCDLRNLVVEPCGSIIVH